MIKVIKEFDFDEIREKIAKTSAETGIYVGCDAKIFGQTTRFITVIVIHHDSCRGSSLFYETVKVNRAMAIREKLWKEVELAGQAASAIAEVVAERPFCVHLDLNGNPHHKSNSLVKAAVAYIEALGFNAVIKPNAFTATHVADHIVRGNLQN